MKEKQRSELVSGIPRREFLGTMGVSTAGVRLGLSMPVGGLPAPANRRQVKVSVRAAFAYPPTARLREEGYFSWPGSTFDAEGRQRQYTSELVRIGQALGVEIEILNTPLDQKSDVSRFIEECKQTGTDGIVLIPFKKSHWEQVVRIVDELDLPAVILAPMGVLLVPHVRQLHRRTGVYLINSSNDLAAVSRGIKMIRTACRMRESLIVNITGTKVIEQKVPKLGTRVRTIPHERFYEAYRGIDLTEGVRQLAAQYLDGAQQVVEPSEKDILDAARTYFAFRAIIETEQADAVMMNCLPGLKRPHQHVPPCMGFMSLRDEGVPMGCESDLDATLTMMLLQELFDRPGFQHNPSADTEKNRYFGAHCTSASRMRGFGEGGEPYILRNHAEAGWGCVPRVLMTPGEDVTIAKYLSSKLDEKAQMLVYSGTIVGCPPIPPTGGCRTNVETTLNELDDVCDLKGHHLCLVYGNHSRELRRFCRLYGIEVVI